MPRASEAIRGMGMLGWGGVVAANEGVNKIESFIAKISIVFKHNKISS